MRPTRGSWLAVAITFAAGGAQAGDPDVADLLLKKARKALASKNYEEAESSFRRALKEMTPLPDAHFGLAETLEKLGRQAEAVDAFRACIKEIEDFGDAPKWKPLKSRAQQAITKLQGRQGEVAKLNEAFIRKCLELGKKVAATDPAVAREAFETVLRLDPSNTAAATSLKQLPGKAAAAPAPEEPPKPPAGRFGETVIDADLWSGAPEWSVGEDSIVGDSPTEGKLFWLTEVPLEGRFGLRGRFRMIGKEEKHSMGVFFGSEGEEPWWGLFISRAGTVSFRRCDVETDHIAKDVILDRFDPKAWHTLQIDIQPGDVTVTLDGKQLFEHNEMDRKTFDGHFCLFVQRARVEWKELEVKR